MVKKNYSDRRFISNLRKFMEHNKPGWTYKRLENGHIELLPRESLVNTKTAIIYPPIPPPVVNTSRHEAAVLQAVATRAFLRPSKFLFERHMNPSTNWRSIRYCWSALSKTCPVVDFWSPVPGVACDWYSKLLFMVSSYLKSGLLVPKLDELNHINIKIGIDGTNIWKAQLETMTFSFAHVEADLYKLPNACHLFMLYVGKENYVNLSTLKFYK